MALDFSVWLTLLGIITARHMRVVTNQPIHIEQLEAMMPSQP